MAEENLGNIVKLLANHNDILDRIEKFFNVKIYSRGEKVFIDTDDRDLALRLEKLLLQFATVTYSGQKLTAPEISYALKQFSQDKSINLEALHNEVVCINNRGKSVIPYTSGQKTYIDTIKNNDITFAIGPAGTGKTYLAVALAVSLLKTGSISRIILVRPVVEAGESLGFLPGDLMDKVEPYLRPLYDSFYELLPPEKFNRYMEKGVIELAPLAYMRGRTLNESFIILDEAQNTTPEQMKMFLTRLGFGSKAVITGDITQIDLPGNKESGLKIVEDILKDVEGIKFIKLNKDDVVRHEIVQRIVRAYEEYDSKRT
ncbi:MAG: PhoH family protein [Synergistaceae bacterium]